MGGKILNNFLKLAVSLQGERIPLRWNILLTSVFIYKCVFWIKGAQQDFLSRRHAGFCVMATLPSADVFVRFHGRLICFALLFLFFKKSACVLGPFVIVPLLFLLPLHPLAGAAQGLGFLKKSGFAVFGGGRTQFATLGCCGNQVDAWTRSRWKDRLSGSLEWLEEACQDLCIPLCDLRGRKMKVLIDTKSAAS